MYQKKLSRREFLRLSALGAAGVALSACAKSKTTEPTTAVQPTKAEVAQPTTSSKEPTPIPTLGPTATSRIVAMSFCEPRS